MCRQKNDKSREECKSLGKKECENCKLRNEYYVLDGNAGSFELAERWWDWEGRYEYAEELKFAGIGWGCGRMNMFMSNWKYLGMLR